MNKKTSDTILVYLAISIGLTGLLCMFIFNTSFANSIIDYFSFFAAVFLIIDGFYKIGHYRHEPYFPNQFIRHVRIIIGTCIFTIHLMQYVRGI